MMAAVHHKPEVAHPIYRAAQMRVGTMMCTAVGVVWYVGTFFA